MTMTALMNEMIREGIESFNNSSIRTGSAVRETEHGEIRLMVQPANCCNSGRNEQVRKSWYLDGKKTAAKKIEAL